MFWGYYLKWLNLNSFEDKYVKIRTLFPNIQMSSLKVPAKK